MLFTRCPDCRTTFRITSEALEKANGQVRCGRCACVFDAYAGLHRRAEHGARHGQEDRAGEAARAASGSQPEPNVAAAAGERTRPPRAVSDRPLEAADDGSGSMTRDARARGPELRTASDASAPEARARVEGGARQADGEAAVYGDLTLETVIEQLESSRMGEGESGSAATAGDAAVRGGERSGAGSAAETPGPAWALAAPQPSKQRATRVWLYGSIALLGLLGLQAAHHFRAELAATKLVGPWLEDAYALLEIEIHPRWDVAQYRILDWVATAEPSASGSGSLRIAARIHNDGPRAQPYPHVHVQLKDRWEGTVGSRVFEPAQYLPAHQDASALMIPDATARAELDIVDPGPDAYGFELDVCVEVDIGRLRCAADAVFRGEGGLGR